MIDLRTFLSRHRRTSDVQAVTFSHVVPRNYVTTKPTYRVVGLRLEMKL